MFVLDMPHVIHFHLHLVCQRTLSGSEIKQLKASFFQTFVHDAKMGLIVKLAELSSRDKQYIERLH